ncbi:MAG: DUF934 domain-containing protein [Azospirillaceae bacterium]
MAPDPDTLILSAEGEIEDRPAPELEISAADDPAALAGQIAAATTVAVRFASFADGRGFSHIRTLRERLGFQGDIRAVGHVIPDQFLFLVRCGASSVEVPAAQAAIWERALGLVTIALQPAVNDARIAVAGPSRGQAGLAAAAAE